MRKTVYSILSAVSAAVLLLSFNASVSSSGAGGGAGSIASVGGTSSSISSSSPGASTASGSGPATASQGAGSAPSTTAGGATTAAGALKSGTFTGAQADTPYGPVQVQVVVANGTITSANATMYPKSGGHDKEINDYAIPILNSEATAAQSAQINMVSGATYTSGGYQSSLQSALDQARS